jgi:VWFA-related protein
MQSRSAFPVVLLAAFLAAPGVVSSQAAAAPPAPAAGSGAITLDVVVTDKSGAPVTGLEPGDFKLLDNKQPQSLTSAQAANGVTARADPPVEALVVIDAINTSFIAMANERQWLADFARENSGELALPTSLVLLTDQGMKIEDHPTRQGSELAAFLADNASGLRATRASEGREGEIEREQASLNSLDVLARDAGKRPGRKLVIWVSPGWSLFSNYSWNGGQKDEKVLFNYIVAMSTALRAANITLYSVDPAGVGRGQFFYRNYLKGVDAPKHADYGDLFLQVLATQSGGQVLFASNDLASLIDKCIADARAYYVLTYTPPSPGHADEYHAIEVQVSKPGLKARTRMGYYAEPSMDTAQTFPKTSVVTVEENRP